ncbi:hypothetical protein FYK55_23555 [Roseiconus nitratireducens]|uniref:Uncharacterized protein n=1 Tax=Roseiconus nitratireducens TaxID=2605748 RepID=A0A5M6CXV8_9BACT|nr:hypothetical protein [Roseiconus nitratireducens]KAA5539776.1 hypothetical protein FYK55_23555 [Roseiconus nitratireducens]
MLKGSVEFVASVESNPIEFDEVQVTDDRDEVDLLLIRADSARGITVSVRISDVSTEIDGVAIARNAADALLDTLAFERRLPIGQPRLIGQSFEQTDPPDETHHISAGVTLHMSCSATTLTRVDGTTIADQLSNSAAASDIHKQMFRSAIRSGGSTERFMHLYNLMMMLFGDHQGRVDRFIQQNEPNVALTQSPHLKTGVMETVYTRLRNEISHHRQGVDLELTKQEMSNHVGRLSEHVRGAIIAEATSTNGP